MSSLSWLLVFPMLILAHHLIGVVAQTKCIANDTRMSNGPYKANLGLLLPALSANVDSTGFYNTSVGQGVDTAYGWVLCRADVQPDVCRDCIQNASLELTESCLVGSQAIRWNELCTLRYSNASMFKVLAVTPGWYWWSIPNASEPQRFMVDVKLLMDDLLGQATLRGSLWKAAWGKINSTNFQSIFALVQCSPDLTSLDCNSCLVAAIGDIPENCDGKIRCRVLMPSCFLRYATIPFYNDTRLQELPASPSTPPSSPPPPRQTSTTPPPPPPTTTPPPPTPPPPGKPADHTARNIIIAVVSVAGILALVSGGVCIVCIRKRRRRTGVIDQHVKEVEPAEFRHETREKEPLHDIIAAESLQYSFGEIKAATDGFSDTNELGEGGFGTVYWGKLTNGQEIAVKRLAYDSGQGDEEFKNEVILVAKLQHRNLVKLLGFSIHGKEKLLIYEFVENLSLDRFIFDRIKRSQLGWERRCQIILGIAKGLLYLHHDSRLRIIHRDLKLSNVLLDREMNPKIADFGLARLYDQDTTRSANTKRIVGTHGYMAPEYAMHGWFSFSSDVFSFGVIILEIISGQKNNVVRDGKPVNILNYAWRSWRQRTVADVIDPVLNAGPTILQDILRYIHIALLCVQENADSRPSMFDVVQMMSNSSASLPMPLEPSFVAPGAYDQEMSIIQEYNSDQSNSRTLKHEASIGDLYPR